MDKLLQALAQLLPTGFAWPRHADSTLMRWLRGLAGVHAELLAFIEQEQLFDSGCGAVDIHLLASARLLPGARLWTLDKPLHALARRLGVAWVVPTR